MGLHCCIPLQCASCFTMYLFSWEASCPWQRSNQTWCLAITAFTQMNIRHGDVSPSKAIIAFEIIKTFGEGVQENSIFLPVRGKHAICKYFAHWMSPWRGGGSRNALALTVPKESPASMRGSSSSVKSGRAKVAAILTEASGGAHPARVPSACKSHLPTTPWGAAIPGLLTLICHVPLSVSSAVFVVDLGWQTKKYIYYFLKSINIPWYYFLIAMYLLD